MALDILEIDFKFPETTYVLAPGLQGKAHWHRIPPDAFVVTVNYGIMIPRVQKHIWIAEDSSLPKLYTWFRDAARDYIAKAYLLEEPYPTPIFDSGYMYETYPNLPYIYHSGPHLSYHAPNYHPYAIIPGLLRGYCTISSKAIQLAVQKGSKRIVLCGVDMQGKQYFDETVTESGYVTGRFGSTWIFTERFNNFLEWLRGDGIDIVSLSPTALDVEVVEEKQP